MFGRWARGGWLLALAGQALIVQAAEVKGIRVWSGPDSTRIVLDLSAPADHRLFTLAGPDRIVVDLSDTSLNRPLVLSEAKGYVSQVRSGSRPGGDLRIVFDLKQAVRPKSFLLPPNDQYGNRLVIDLVPDSGDVVVKRAPAAETSRGRNLVVVIDPGHGGDDPGASGRHGVLEKDVVLAIARRLTDELKRQPGIDPVLTRDGDYFVELDRRRKIAHEAQADLFVSIHADSYRDPGARGATVYVLSEKGASDEVARRLAERENASDLIGGVSLADKDPILRQVLLDLSQTAAMSASTAVGEHLIERLGSVTPMRRTQVQRARFVVLRQPDIPSILVETAYISNPKQEAQLHDSAYQAQLARALYAGILDYFQANPPPGSYLALNETKRVRVPIRYVIGRGDTLSDIAERYNVSLPDLKRSNRIKGDVIRVGQVLTIPQG
ncbi:MAG TPA: N-acetylmuramoyl-L-alanine amidase [Gammaproteobacteria bacterium]|nr:N-acetylmuramoyl-L-alanine amidase [Gammaproteobacteria bacterium]